MSATTHALFARKVQRKLSNGVAGFAAAGSSLDRQKSRQFLPSQRRRLMTNVCASTSAKSRPELRIPTAAAQTRVVSGGEVWPIQRELSRHLKYMARARISEFESYHLSQAVRSPPANIRKRPPAGAAQAAPVAPPNSSSKRHPVSDPVRATETPPGARSPGGVLPCSVLSKIRKACANS